VIEHSADPIDQGTELAQYWLEQAEREARAKNKPEQVQGPDGKWPHTECVSCGEDIPEGRLKLGRIRCVECQSAREKRDQQYGAR
jgi:RNA polymerase-binding transcription factor DksA